MKEKTMFILLILSSLSLGLCEYEKLSKYSSVKVKPDTNVYLDLSSFNVGELITLEIRMDLFFGDTRSYYTFSIDQVPASNYYETSYWNNLRTVKNSNVTCSSSEYCTFTWEEIKKQGNNYIFIKTPAPFSNFYSFWGNKIKIVNTGGLSTGEIVGIVFGVIGFIVIVGVIVYFSCLRKRYSTLDIQSNSTVPQPYQTTTPPVYQPTVPVYQPPNPAYPPSVPVYQPPNPVQPYSQGYQSGQGMY